jgi:hypothetical protein
MLGLTTRKPQHKAGPDVHFVVYRSRQCAHGGSMGFTEPATRSQAMRAFDACVAKGDITPTNGRRLIVAGPDYLVQPDDPNDPLLIGDAAVKAVLSPAEYQAHLGQFARYALEAE